MDYIKVGGSWKKAKKRYIKVNGKWKEVSKVYEKVSGKWVDVKNASASTYKFDGTASTLQDGSRVLVNKNGANNFVAKLLSGRSVSLSKDGVVKVPINYDGKTVQGSVAYFDGSSKEFVQVINPPLSTHYELKDGTYGVITKLHTNHFSTDDLKAFNEKPELMLDWALNGADIPSGIVYDHAGEDRIYFNMATEYSDLEQTETLPYDGSATYNTKQPYGIQDILLELNDAGVPTSLSTHMEGNGDILLPLLDKTKAQITLTDCVSEIHGDTTKYELVKCTP